MSGLRHQLGFKEESTYGTYVAPTTFLHTKGSSLEPVIKRVQAESFRGGQFAAPAAHYVDTVRGGKGTIPLEVMTTGMGKLLRALMGSSASAQQAATAAYKQTHTLADTVVGQSLSVQASRPPRAGGSAVPVTLKGAKVTAAEFECKTDGLLGASFSLDAQDWDNTTALAVASYSNSAVPFGGTSMCVKLGAYGSEASTTGIKSVKVSIKRNLDTEAYYACNGALKAEPAETDWPVEITGSMSQDWAAKTDIEDLAVAKTSTCLDWVFTGANIASTYDYTFRLRLPGIIFEPAAQTVAGRDILSKDWDFVYRYDGTNTPVIEYITTDTAI